MHPPILETVTGCTGAASDRRTGWTNDQFGIIFPIMSFATRPLEQAIARLLRPLCRLMLRNGVSFGAFGEIAKRTYVDVAMSEFTLPGKKPSISRASILTGLTRKEVQRLVAEADGGGPQAGEHYNRATRVLTAWLRDPDFQDGGQPRALPVDGDRSFVALVRRHSGDMPARAMLDELQRVGAVRRRDDGQVELVTRAYVPQHGAAEKLHILGTDVSDLIDTIDHNLQHGAAHPRFQRKVLYHGIPPDAAADFRALAAREAQALLERLDAWLADRDDAAPGAPRVRVGLGIHAIETAVQPTEGPSR